MSGYDDHDLLTTTLRDRAGDMDGHTLGLDDVKGRARGIQRRRRAVSGAVAAAVLAVAVPVGLNVTDVDRGQQPLPTNPSPSVVETPEPSPSGPVTIDAAAAPRGQDPTMVYLDGRVLHEPGQPDLRLPATYSAVAPYADGWVGISTADGTTAFLDAEGNPTQPPYDGATAAVSADGQWLSTVLYATGGVDLQLWPTAGAPRNEGYTSNVVSFDGTLDLAGFVGPQTVAYNLTTTGPQGATVTPYVTDWSSEPRELDGLLDVIGASEANGTVTGMTELDQPAGTACYAVVDVSTGERAWETCDYALGKFSADGRYVLGTDAYVDGLGGRQVAILDAKSGDVLVEFTTPDGALVQDAVWESRSTVLVPSLQDGGWFLVRLRPDGTVERALDGPVTGYDDSSPWRFAVTP